MDEEPPWPTATVTAASYAPRDAGEYVDPEVSSSSSVADPSFDPLLNPPPPSRFALADDDDDVGGSDGEIVALSPRSNFIETASANSPDYVHITVADPRKENEPSGSGTFVSYLISSRPASDVAGGRCGAAACEVRRRFRDVVSLADSLAEAHRGLFVPTRPDKGVVESQVMQKSDFIEQRRVALEKYLRRLAKHPVISKSEDFVTFLRTPTYSGSALARSTVMNGGEEREREFVVTNVAKGKDLFGIFKDFRQTAANAFASARPPPVEEEMDVDFLKRKEKLQELEQQILNSSQKAEELVKAQQDVAETMGEFGMTFIKVAKFETVETTCDPQRTLSAEMRNFATAVLKASRVQRGLNSQVVNHLDTLHEYLNLIMCAHNAFADRASALRSVQALSADLYLLHIRAGRLEGDSSRHMKLEELKDSIRTTEEAKGCAVRAYERIKENNRTEFERFDRERCRDFTEMLKRFVATQVAYAEKLANLWQAAAEETKQYSGKRVNHHRIA